MEQIIYKWSWERIDIFLAKNFDYSRNFFHHIIKRWWVLVNWKTIKKSYKLKNNDQIQIENLERYLNSSFLHELPFVEIPIVLEKNDYLIINKPKWVLSHPNSIWDLSTPSVVAFLYQRYKELPSIWNFIRAWLIHRLDKETDWLMIIAKTEKWLKYFKELFNRKSQLIEQIIAEVSKPNPDFSKLEEIEEKVWLKKFYKAKVNITIKGKKFLENIQLPHYIAKVVKPKTPYSVEKMGITKILGNLEIKNNFGNYTNFKSPESQKNLQINLQIITWRTHQIRYHLSQHWLPIIWDKLYWNKENYPMQLTAYKLEFIDINWEKISLEI